MCVALGFVASCSDAPRATVSADSTSTPTNDTLSLADGSATDAASGPDADAADVPTESDAGTQASAAPAAPQTTFQTTCYDVAGAATDCGGTGQDGELRSGVGVTGPRFTDRGDGTVRDNLTGLIWLKDAGCLGKVTWSEALTLSNALASGSCGLSDGSAAGDWHLPNFVELVSLLQWSRTEWASGGKALADGHPFENVPQQLFWTSTTTTDGTDEARAVNLGWSGVFKAGEPKSLDYWVLPVRNDADTANAPVALPATNQTDCFDASGASVACDGTGQDGDIRAGVVWPQPRFTDNGDGSITDNLTGLVWLQQADCFDPAGFDQALASSAQLADGACNLSDGSAAGDWRLPNFRELFSLLDWSQFNPILTAGHPFKKVPLKLHWTSTASLPGGDGEARDRAWTISPYFNGNFHPATKTSEERFLPVRDP